MTYKKLLSSIAGLTLLVAAFVPVRVGALGQASMTLSGATNTNGNFSVIVYENTGSDTVTGAKVELSFSQAVTSVSYDYSVGPFTAVTPSGAHNAYGTVTGTNPVARVSFKLVNPGSVTASVNGNSYLKHVEGTVVQYFDISRGSANFTYSAPAPSPSTGGGSTPADGGLDSSNAPSGSNSPTKKTATTNNGSSTTGNENEQPTTDDAATGEVKDDTTKKDDSKSDEAAKNDDTKKTSDNGSAWYEILAMIIAASLAFLAGRRYRAHRMALKARLAEEAAAAAAAAKAKKTPKKKPTSKKTKK
jgi:hypothetical protein